MTSLRGGLEAGGRGVLAGLVGWVRKKKEKKRDRDRGEEKMARACIARRQEEGCGMFGWKEGPRDVD